MSDGTIVTFRVDQLALCSSGATTACYLKYVEIQGTRGIVLDHPKRVSVVADLLRNGALSEEPGRKGTSEHTYATPSKGGRLKNKRNPKTQKPKKSCRENVSEEPCILGTGTNLNAEGRRFDAPMRNGSASN